MPDSLRSRLANQPRRNFSTDASRADGAFTGDPSGGRATDSRVVGRPCLGRLRELKAEVRCYILREADEPRTGWRLQLHGLSQLPSALLLELRSETQQQEKGTIKVQLKAYFHQCR